MFVLPQERTAATVLAVTSIEHPPIRVEPHPVHLVHLTRGLDAPLAAGLRISQDGHHRGLLEAFAPIGQTSIEVRMHDQDEPLLAGGEIFIAPF